MCPVKCVGPSDNCALYARGSNMCDSRNGATGGNGFGTSTTAVGAGGATTRVVGGPEPREEIAERHLLAPERRGKLFAGKRRSVEDRSNLGLERDGAPDA